MNISKETDCEAIFKPGFQIGIGMDYYFTKNLGLQTGLNFVTKGYKVKDVFYYSYDEEIKPEYVYKKDMVKNNLILEVPLLLAVRMNINEDFRLIISFGGYASCGVGGKSNYKWTHFDATTSKESYKIYPNDKRWDAGLSSGMSIEYHNKYSIGVSGQWGLVDQAPWNDSRKTHQTYGLNIGYKF